MALLWRIYPYHPGDGTWLAPRRCDAVESATQKENGGVLSGSPKNEKSNLTATLCQPIAQSQTPHIIGEKKGLGGWQQWWGKGSKTIPAKQTKTQTNEMEILKKKHSA